MLHPSANRDKRRDQFGKPHKRINHPGQHDAIVDRTTWQRVQELLGERAARKRGLSGAKTSGVLTGKLFDENGQPLYSCGAKKGDRRYRYFVSRNLVREPGQSEGNIGWRLPAEETERAVPAGMKQILRDRRALASALKVDGVGAADFPKVLEAAEAVAKALDRIGPADEASGMVERVELRSDGMQISVNLQRLLAADAMQAAPDLRMTRLIPMQMKRRGVETRLVIPGEAIVPARTDPALLRTLARGYRWFGELASGKVPSTRQIAMRERLSDSYVRHVVPLGMLAPELVESICAGNPPASLSAERLKTVRGVPSDWAVQLQALRS
jgi:site-specific DNA recombinase